MPAKGYTRSQSSTRLSLIRHRAAMTQTEIAVRMGVSIATYQRLEEGRMANPPLGYLVNAAIILNVPSERSSSPSGWTGGTSAARAPSRRRAAGAEPDGEHEHDPAGLTHPTRDANMCSHHI